MLQRVVRFLTKTRTGVHLMFWLCIFMAIVWFMIIYAVAYRMLQPYGPLFTDASCDKSIDKRVCEIKMNAFLISALSPFALLIIYGFIWLVYAYCTWVSSDIRADMAEWDVAREDAVMKKA